MVPRGHYVNSIIREKTGSKEVEKISQITQIKGWNLRVKFYCRKSLFLFPMKKNITCGVKWVCVLGGTEDRVIESRATVYREALQSGEFLHRHPCHPSYTHYTNREGEQWRHVWSQVTNLWSFCWAHGVQRQSLEEEGKQFHSHDFGCPCQLSNTQERDPNALSPCCSTFSEHLPIFPIPLSAR